MEANKKHITSENISEWLCSTGYLFPRNEVELARFEKLFSDTDVGVTGQEIDPQKIINGLSSGKVIIPPTPLNENEIGNLRMVARNGAGLSKDILDKMKKNQSQKKNNDSGAQEEETE